MKKYALYIYIWPSSRQHRPDFNRLIIRFASFIVYLLDYQGGVCNVGGYVMWGGM